MSDAKKINLEDFRKEFAEKMESWTTSVYLTTGHKKFLEEEQLNLSGLVRFVLDGLMAEKYGDGKDD